MARNIHDGIGTPIRLRSGTYDGIAGAYWAWPVDGYFDVHHAPEGMQPDGSEVVGEFLPSLKEARAFATAQHRTDF